MKKSNSKKVDITIQTHHEFEFKLFPGTASTKPYIYFYYTNPVTGKDERIRKLGGLKPGSSIPELKAQAKKPVSDLIELLSSGWNPIDSTLNEIPITPLSNINECLDYWYTQRVEKHKNKAISTKTLIMNEYLVGFFKEWLAENKYLNRKAESFNKVDIDKFMEATANKRSWSKVSYNRYRTDMGTIFIFLKTLRIITHNPVKASNKKITKHDSSRFKIYEKEELSDVVTLLRSDKRFLGLYIASKMIFHYNLRPIELTRIQINNIDFTKRLLTLEPEKTKNGNEAIFVLSEEMYNLLDDYTANYPTSYFVFGHRSKPAIKQSHEEYFAQKFKWFRIEFNLSHTLKIYALKHSSNYYDIENGANYEEIRQRNRHSNLQVTTAYIKERLFKNKIKPSSSMLFS